MTGPLFEEWVHKAEEDYLAASSLDPVATPGPVCFHCQQCVEKYLKAAFLEHGVPIRRTHNLIVLNDLVAEHVPGFEQLCDELLVLNPYSVMIRYPGLETTGEEAKRALEIASSLRRRIRSLLGLQTAM